MKFFAIAIFLLLLLSSCATLSEKDCKGGDWRSIGYDDGKNGQDKNSRLEAHGKACAEYAIKPNLKTYEVGYKLGTEVYCTQAGEEHGERGDMITVPGLCLDSEKFEEARKTGFQTYCKNQGIESGKNVDDSKVIIECRNSESYKQGYEEGLRQYCNYNSGMKLGLAASEHKANLCPLHLKADFLSGYNKGILDYCSKRNGFQLARDNKQLSAHQCPHPQKGEFESAYQQGMKYLELQKKHEELEFKKEKLMTKLQDNLISMDLRKHLLAELEEKKREQGEIKIQMAKIEGFVGL